MANKTVFFTNVITNPQTGVKYRPYSTMNGGTEYLGAFQWDGEGFYQVAATGTMTDVNVTSFLTAITNWQNDDCVIPNVTINGTSVYIETFESAYYWGTLSKIKCGRPGDRA